MDLVEKYLKQPTERDLKGWAKWLKGRPPSVRSMAKKMPPWTLFRMKDTEQIVSVIGYFEDGTVRVHVHEDPRAFGVPGWEVFGVKPDDLTVIPSPSSASA
jgi:precorrin-6B methylase 1